MVKYMWQEELPLSFKVNYRVRTWCLQGVGVTGGVAIFRMGKGRTANQEGGAGHMGMM